MPFGQQGVGSAIRRIGGRQPGDETLRVRGAVEQAVLFIQGLARKIHLGDKAGHRGGHLKMDVRRPGPALCRRIGGRFDRLESVAAVGVLRADTVSLEMRIERSGIGVAGMGVSPEGVCLPDFDARSGDRPALQVENPAAQMQEPPLGRSRPPLEIGRASCRVTV